MKTKIPHTTDTNCEETRCQIDTGSICNLISENDCEKLVAGSPMRLTKTKVLLKMYDGPIMKPLGSTPLFCKFGGVKQKIQFQMVPGKRTLLLSAETSEALGLVTLNAPQEVLSVSKTTCEYQPLTKENIVAQYGDVFHGLGCLPGELIFNSSRPRCDTCDE